jgi:1-deoxy-D-xylulose-5-phosphate reductoisomerase
MGLESSRDQGHNAPLSTRRLAILGSTGSIGLQTLDVADEHEDLHVVALAAGSNARLLARQARRYRPRVVALADEAAADGLRAELPDGTTLLTGPQAMTRLVEAAEPDVLLTAVVGSAGLAPTMAAIEAGCDLAIANKETLVMAGSAVIPAARAAGVELLPVDSEHSAIYQCLQAGRPEELQRVCVTASGGSLRDWDDDAIARATIPDVLNHPTWSMGAKITVDSATLINKALEIIEAHWLFDLPAERIDVLIHRESIVHSLVEFRDGNVIAQLSRPDMKLPIAYALHRTRRPPRSARALDLASVGALSFREPTGRFRRALELGYEVIRRGGTSGAVLNGANEQAVECFLAGQLPFARIVPLVEDILNRHVSTGEVTIETLLDADARARREVLERVEADCPAPGPERI